MISRPQADECISKMGMLGRFPQKDNIVAEIGKLLNTLCQNDHEARRLTGLVLARWSEWQGPSKLKALFDSEIASQRPREAEPDGCDKCRGLGGLRRVFQVFERVADGSERKQVIYPEGDVGKAERELYERYRDNPRVKVYTSVVAPCSCPLGMRRRDEIHQLESGRRHDATGG